MGQACLVDDLDRRAVLRRLDRAARDAPDDHEPPTRPRTRRDSGRRDPELLDDVDGRQGGPPGREQVVHHQNALALDNGVHVDLDAVHPVLELVVLANGRKGQLALLAHRHESRFELIGHGSAQNEPARLDAGDLVHRHALPALERLLQGDPEANRVPEEGREIGELDAGFRVIRNGSDA